MWKKFYDEEISFTVGVSAFDGAVASAAPAENYEAGKVSINLGTTILPKLEVSPGTSSDASNDFSGGLTVGLGHNFALQYGYDKTGAKEVNTYYEDVGYTEKDNGKVTANTVNLLYKINPKVSAYLGNRHVSGELNCQWGGYDLDGSFYADKTTNVTASKNYVQAGLIGQTELAKNLTGWGNIGVGSGLLTCQVGVGYRVTSNLTANLYYDYAQYKDMASYNGQNFDITTKGLKAGITLNF